MGANQQQSGCIHNRGGSAESPTFMKSFICFFSMREVSSRCSDWFRLSRRKLSRSLPQRPISRCSPLHGSERARSKVELDCRGDFEVEMYVCLRQADVLTKFRQRAARAFARFVVSGGRWRLCVQFNDGHSLLAVLFTVLPPSLVSVFASVPLSRRRTLLDNYRASQS